MAAHVDVKIGQDARGSVVEVSALGHEAGDVADAVAHSIDDLADRDHAAVWVDHPTTALDDTMVQIDLQPRRDLYLMDISLPLEVSSSIATRPFVPGQDEQAWVTVNNRAFAWHREQSGWTVDDVNARMAEPWFDRNGFLIHEVDDEILGFCWTRIHDDLDPPAGEIYVIAVDPAGQGRGLGRELTVAGLESICQRGFTRGFLYVDADNTKAVSLYNQLGFEIDTIRRLYTA